MPILTPTLLQRIKTIIEKHHNAFLVNVLGRSVLPPKVVEHLEGEGVLEKDDGATTENAYLYGRALAALEQPGMEDWSAPGFLAWLKQNPIPLSAAEQAAVQAAKMTAAAYVQGLGNVVEKDTNRLLIDADANLRASLKGKIADATAENVARRESVKRLKSDLGLATEDWARGLDRIAITEKHNAMEQGTVDGIRQKGGDNAEVSIIPAPDACASCKALHLGPDGKPRIFKLSQLAPPGANIKKKPQDWVPSIGAVHPHCGCKVVRVPPGWGYNADGKMVPGGRFGMRDEDDVEKSFHLEKARKLAGRMKFQGLDISLEHNAGDKRVWKDRNGEEGVTIMRFPYGYVRKTEGTDGDHVDVYVGPHADAENAYVVDQRRKGKNGTFHGFDEQKVMLGFNSAAEAKAAYLAQYNDPGFFGGMHMLPMAEFKRQVLGTRDGGPKKLRGIPHAEPQERFVIPVGDSVLEKAAGPFIGPHGGKWADAAHTIPWHDSFKGLDSRHHALIQRAHQKGVVVVRSGKSNGKPFGTRDRKAAQELMARGVFEHVTSNVSQGSQRNAANGPSSAAQRSPELESVYRLTPGHKEHMQSGVVELTKALNTLVPRNTTNPGWQPQGSVLLSDMEPREEAWLQDLEKGGPYVGPRGGLWADPKHTVHWEAVPKWAQQMAASHGAEIHPHPTDAGSVQVAVPVKHAPELGGAQTAHGVPNKVKLSNDLKQATLQVPKLPVAAQPEPAKTVGEEAPKAGAQKLQDAGKETEKPGAETGGGETKVVRMSDFRETGEYLVTLPNGKTARIYKDPESKYWYEAGTRNTSLLQDFLGFTQAEALEKLRTRKPKPSPMPVNPPYVSAPPAEPVPAPAPEAPVTPQVAQEAEPVPVVPPPVQEPVAPPTAPPEPRTDQPAGWDRMPDPVPEPVTTPPVLAPKPKPAPRPMAAAPTPPADIPEVPGMVPATTPGAAELNRQRAREVGQHIESSRKDAADILAKVKAGELDKVSYADAARMLRKESLMPALTAEHYRDMGATPGAAHLALTISSLVAGKPKDDDASRRAYMEGVRMVIGGLEKIRSVDDAVTFQKELQDHARSAGRGKRALTPEELALFNSEHIPGQIAPRILLERKIAAELGIPTSDITTSYRHSNAAVSRPDSASFEWVDQKQRRQIHDMYRALGPRFIAGMNLSVPKEADTGRAWGDSVKFRFGSSTAFGRAKKDAEGLDKDGWAAFEAKDAEKTKLPEDPNAPPEEKKERRKAWKRDASEEPEVIGASLAAKGDPKRFQDTFRLTSVQPGENIPDAEYEFHLRHAETALNALAEVVGVAPSDISLNGRLGIAFAARGRGKAAAHYESGQKAINITRFRGAGSVAHEWGHFLDNVMAEVHGGKGTSGRGEFASEFSGHSGMPPDVRDAFVTLHRAITIPDPESKMDRAASRVRRLVELQKQASDISNQMAAVYREPASPERKAKLAKLSAEHEEVREAHKNIRATDPNTTAYLEHAAAMNGKGGSKKGYWTEGTELFARAFESFVQDKLENSGKRNSYLVDGTRKTYATGVFLHDGSEAQPYPQGEERKRINSAFENLMGVLARGNHLKKAQAYLDTLGKAAEPNVGATMLDASGGGVNVQADAPPRPVQSNQDPVGMRFYLMEGAPRTHILKRDPHIYEYAANQRAPRPIQLTDGVMDSAHDPPEDTLVNREDLERQLLQNTLVPRNTANPGWEPQGSVRLSTQEAPEKVQTE